MSKFDRGRARYPSNPSDELDAALVKGFNAADVKKRFAEEGAEVVANTPAEFGDFFQKEITKWDGLFTVVAKPSL